MAPSAVTSEQGHEDAEMDTNSHTNSVPSPDGSVPADGFSKLYTDAYTHGYTEGYIKANLEPDTPSQMPIAIVGMSCRLPGNVTTPDEFWELCSRARSGFSEIPKERFENASFHHPNQGRGGCFNAVGGNFLKEDLGLFDAPFFSLTAQEATSMDPQQRLMLECTFEALESAGIPKHQIVGKEVGVFIGGSFSEYESQLMADTETIPMYQATGCAFAMQSNRISHFFDLRGPSFTMDTACSSSMVALHQACLSLRTGESKSAIVGGCHLNMLPEFWISFGKSRLFSDEGRSFSFDSRGTGYGRGEGCGMMVLKPLEQALKDNDNIRSVIVASGINQDGRTPGITMPNGDAQESLIRQVYKNAGIDPKETGYVEAHGTGTKVGDPIEARALYNVFGEERTVRNPLFIGSVKSNIGHLEAASGIVAVIKAALMLERGFILPNYDFKKPNEKIPFAKWGLKVPVSQRPWPRPKRFASVNNFGFGGTNGHVVLERAPFIKKYETEQTDSSVAARKVFVLSANDKVALETLMKNIGIYLEQRPEIFQNDLMSNVAYTLGQRRSLMQWRVAISCTNSFDLIQALNSGKVVPSREIDPPRIGFIFTGQGAQWHAMGRELYDQYPVFASTLDACDRYLDSLGASFSLLNELRKDVETSLINEAQISQPACTAIQLALTDLLREWGITPSAVAGHSSGEIGAAYAAGILPLQSCMAISYHRGMATLELRKKFPDLKGSMMAVGCTKEEIAPLMANLTTREVRIACFNSPTSLTLSGDEPAIDELQAILEKKAIFNRKLMVDVAYHSHHMELVAESYRNLMHSLEDPKVTDVKFHSSLLGHVVKGSRLEPSYWVENLTQSVRFSEAVASMCAPVEGHKTGVNFLIELGPSSALAGPIKQILKSCGANAMKIPYGSPLVRNKDAVETALALAATLFTKGATLDMGAINLSRQSKPPALLVDMPRYPWNHQTKYWHEPRVMQKHKNRTVARNDLLGTIANYSNDLEPTWRNILRIDEVPWLRHHRIQGLTLFPMSGFISMAVEAAGQRAVTRNMEYDSFELRDIIVSNPLMVTDEDVEMTLQLRPYQEGSTDSWDEFRVHSWAANKGWTEHCKGLIGVKCHVTSEVDGGRVARETKNSLQSTITQIVSGGTAPVEKTKLYDALSELGVAYGPSFQGMNDCQASDTCSTANLIVVDTKQDMPKEFQTPMIIHPALLEQLVEMYWPIIGAGRDPINTVYLPSSISRMTLSRNITELTKNPGDSLRAFCQGAKPTSHPVPIQMSMFATATVDSPEALIRVEDLTIAPIVERSMSSENDAHRELCYKLEWESIFEPSVAAQSNGVSEHTNGDAKDDSSLITNDVVIVHGDSESQVELAFELAKTVEHMTGKQPELGTLTSVKPEGKLCLFISELHESLLSSLTSKQFTDLQRILTNVQGILWVVRGAYTNATNPDANMVTGLSRSIRSETLLKFATLDLDPGSTSSVTDIVDAILKVLSATFGSKADANCELEFTQRAGKFYTPRIINDAEMNEYVYKKTKASVLEPTPFIQAGRPLQLAIETPGAFETLHFVDQVLEETLLEDEIEIEVKAVGMNASDLNSSTTGTSIPEGFGMECAGVITQVGSGICDLKVGDRVAGLSVSGGVYSTLTRSKANTFFQIPDLLAFEAAASIPLAFCTARHGLALGSLEKDDKILIHGAGSAVGQAAIWLSQVFGADIYATVNTVESKQLLIKDYGVAEDHIFPSHQHSLASAVRMATGNAGIDVVLDCISAESDILRELWDSLNEFGRFIQTGKGKINAKLDMSRLASSNRGFLSFDLHALATQRPKIMTALVAGIAELMKEDKIRPIAQNTVFPISDIETAFRTLQKGNVEGKLIVAPQSGDQVRATPSTKGNTLLRAEATYILIGGTGGLGRTMARWMVTKGAKNLVLVSRSGSETGKVKELIDEAATSGAKILVRSCDVANNDSVQDLITKQLTGLPPVRGVIHGSMVLKDVLFEKMAYEQYTTVIEGKVQGAWNFHNALKSTPLDFFIALSSAAGAVGNRGQAAYAAANTFLNAFVQHRHSLSLPASSLDLTAVSDAGYLAENADAAAEVAKNLGSDTICSAEVLALLQAAIDGTLQRACNGHTITGMRITSPPPFWTPDAKFTSLRLAAEAASSSANPQAAVSFHALLAASTSLPEAQDVVCRGLLSKLPPLLMLEAEDMDITRSLANYALDSLVAIEVRNYITREFEANLQVLELLSSGSIEMLAKTICGKSKLVSFS